jgi:mRNA interferase MazF
VARRVARGEIWLYRFAPPDRRRPVLVLSRGSLLESLHTATVVAITSALRGSPTEVRLGPDEGLKNDSCANLANLFTVRQADLRRYVGFVAPAKMREVCRALVLACGCD